jgi:coatomer protein complex subunit alpha (xenin)
MQLKTLVEQMRSAYKLFQRADALAEAKGAFQRIITSIPMVVVERAATDEVKEVLAECREYILGISMELERRSLDDKTRQTELAAYFTCCKLQPMHLMLVLNQAMVQAFKLNNFITAASFAQRLLNMREINSPSQAALKTKAAKVLSKSEQNARNEKKLDYPEQGQQFSICSASYRPILLGQPSIKCPYCGAVATPEHANQLCKICTLSPLGVETLGLVCSQDR